MGLKALFGGSAKLSAVFLVSAALAACGGGGETIGGGGGGTPGGGGGTPGDTTLRLGDLSSGSFQNGVMSVGSANLAAGGSTGLSVDIVDAAGLLASGSHTVSFNSNCIASGTATLNPADVTTSNGRVSTTYTARGCTGTDTVTARLTANGTVLTATGAVTIEEAALGGIEFVSATPAIIGMTGSPITSQSEVVFRLKDASGGVLIGRTAQFSLDTAVGGITLTPSQGISDAGGLVRTVVQAGSVSTAVRVKATAVNPANGLSISSQSEVLAISTGLPDSDSVSLSAQRHVLDGACDGESTPVSIRAADRYNNPVPQGTAFSFRAEGGKINAQCVTGDPLGNPATEAGVCSVTFTVQNPRPSDGRVSILANALGEESFVDANGNGFYDLGEAFDDVAEAFVDNNENGVWDPGESFVDGNENAGYDGGNGQFDGYVCSAPGQNCSYNTVHVSEGMTLVFSRTDVNPQITFDPVALAIQQGTTATLEVLVADINQNSLPTGTTYSLSVDIGSVLQPTTQGPFNDSSVGGDVVLFSIKAPDTTDTPGVADAGNATLNITVPASGCSSSKVFTTHFAFTVTP